MPPQHVKTQLEVCCCHILCLLRCLLLSAPAALSSHPLVAFLARQLLSDCVAAAGSSELVTQQLGLLHRLFGASAAVAAVPGASWSADSRQSAEAVVDLLAAVLQVCVAGRHYKL
jgi:hypothetical protein